MEQLTTAIVSTFSIGGATAAYLRSEFSSGPVNGLLFGPVISALNLLRGEGHRWESWLVLPFFLMAAAMLRITLHRHRTSS
jgi:hypothetical protein